MTSATDRGCSTLLGQRTVFDALVDATDRIDAFCSSTDWILPLHRRFGSGEVIVEVSDGAALAVSRLPGRDRRSLLCGLDIMWGYARPVVGPDVGEGVALVERVLAEHRRDAAGLLLTGVDPRGAFAARLTERLRHRMVASAEPVGRRIAWLDDGVEGFLARRSPSFRRNARQATRRAEEAGVRFEWMAGGGAALVQRAIGAERRSWKGRQGSGLSDPGFAAFYLDLAEQLGPSGRLRAGFASLDGEDIGYILGAVRGGSYRGLQLAYATEAHRLSVGNLLQLGQMRLLAEEGVTRYDLGQDMAYKVVWSDELFVTETVLLGA